MCYDGNDEQPRKKVTVLGGKATVATAQGSGEVGRVSLSCPEEAEIEGRTKTGKGFAGGKSDGLYCHRRAEGGSSGRSEALYHSLQCFRH